MSWTDAGAHILGILLAWLVGEAAGIAGFSFDRGIFLRLLVLVWIVKCLWHIGAWTIEEGR